jgi:hypothetical protein
MHLVNLLILAFLPNAFTEFFSSEILGKWLPGPARRTQEAQANHAFLQR